jgi:drug/metabolite transporter (DMT)-like permease
MEQSQWQKSIVTIIPVILYTVGRSIGVNEIVNNERLDLKAASLLTLLCILWGLNAVSIKVSNVGIDPIFAAGLRSVIATLSLIIWMKQKGLPLFPGSLLDGVVVGVIFGLEFGLLYTSLLFTTVASAWILLYATPFFHALGAHFWLEGDRLTVKKGMGLLLAFGGVVLLLSKHFGLPSAKEFLGDILAILSAILWAATTIYIKRRLVGKVSHHHTLFYQMIFSIPILFCLSALFHEAPIRQINGFIILSVAYQGLGVAFISYLLWFLLVHSHSVTRLSAFTFLTPVFAALAGSVFLHEPIHLRLIFILILVSSGIYLVNRG